jgi:tetratricopeptide (TPR) repeat protein
MTLSAWTFALVTGCVGAAAADDEADAVAIHRVVGTSTIASENAQFRLAALLHRLQYPIMAYAIVSEIADRPTHVKFEETLPWLAKLADELPEPADIIERVGKYDDARIGKLDPSTQSEVRWLLGRYKYRNRQYDTALELFEKVDESSPYSLRARFFAGIANVQLRKSVPAIRSFLSARKGSTRDLADLSIARTYYSSAMTGPSIDQRRLSAAISYWNEIDPSSDLWQSAMFESAWAHFMIGDYSRALGNIVTVKSPFFDTQFPEADILKAITYYVTCRYDDARLVVVSFRERYSPVRERLAAELRGKDDETFYGLLTSARDPLIVHLLADRELVRHRDWVRAIDDERAHLARSTPSFRESALGTNIRDALQLARDVAIRTAGEIVHARLTRALRALDEQLENSSNLLVDIGFAEKPRATPVEMTILDVAPDREHVRWPFVGEYWSDELGTYREVVRSSCQ